MLVLHGLLGPHGPVVWAEDASRWPSDQTGLIAAGRHPFAARAVDLRRAVRAALGGDVYPVSQAPVLLPSDAAGPLRSPTLASLPADTDAGGPPLSAIPAVSPADAGADIDVDVADTMPDQGPDQGTALAGRPSQRRWRVSVITLDLADPHLVDRPLADLERSAAAGASGWVPAASFRFLLLIRDLAVDLVDRGRVLPTARTGEGTVRAAWAPVLTGADAARFDALRDAMPPVVRAHAPLPARSASRAHPMARAGRMARADRTSGWGGATASASACGEATARGDVLRRALDDLVDAVVRRRLAAAGHHLVPEPRSGALVTRWVAALGPWPAASASAGEGRGAGAGEAAGVGTGEMLGAGVEEVSRAVVTGPGQAVRELAARVEGWRGGVLRASTARVCLRLHEPADAADPAAQWRVEFLLQPLVDRSLLVGADRVWDGRADRLAVWADHPQDTLLAGLGRAASVWPLVRRALLETRPTGLILDVNEAYAFLRAADGLERAGLAVLVPSWWRRRARVSLGLGVRCAQPVVPSVRDAAMSLDQLVDFRWSVSLGGERLSQAELAELAAAKMPLVRVRGRWTHVDPDLLAAGLARLREQAGARMTARDVLGHAGLLPAADPEPAGPAGVGRLADPDLRPDAGIGPPPDRVRAGLVDPDALADLDIEVSADGWLGGLLAGPGGAAAGAGGIGTAGGAQDDQVEFVDPPAGLAVELRPYQRRGLAWLAFLDRVSVGALLADDMGLGKTVQVLALELFAREAGPRAPTLVVCPTSVVGHWEREAARAAPGLRIHVHHAADRAVGGAFVAVAARHDLVITTYSVVRRDAAALASLSWDRIVLDEAQQIKNSGIQLAGAVRQLPARHRVALTGTPVENRLADLWSIMHVLNPGLLGGASRFRARYAVPIERYDDAQAAARLRRRLRPVLLRRIKSDPAVLADLPEKMEFRDLCVLTAEQASLYRAVVDDMLERLADTSPARRKGAILAAMTRLKQVCNHPAHLLDDGSPLAGRSGKLARLEELLERITADGERALCFTQYARYGAMLAPYLAERFGVDVPFLHGGVPRARRDAMVERFQRGHGPGIFLLSLKAGGTGLTLTAANHVIHLDRWWNPAAQAQATDRAHRIGQRRGVQVRTLVCMGTLEERIDRMLADKTALARSMIVGGESWLAGLSTSQLRDLCTLSASAEVIDGGAAEPGAAVRGLAEGGAG